MNPNHHSIRCDNFSRESPNSNPRYSDSYHRMTTKTSAHNLSKIRVGFNL